MRISNQWSDYELIDTSCGEKLERWGNIILIRPDPQIIWSTLKTNKCWNNYNARYIRSSSGGGHWDVKKNFPEKWVINYKDLSFIIKPTGFKHTGLFPEQATNWDYIYNKIKKSPKQISVLNLFAYTGGATLFAAKAGAKVCHVDSSKGMVSWAKENAALCNLSSKPIRWIVDDCIKFINREYKRNNRYDAIILDPPSYGRGPNGEIWKLEENIYELLLMCTKILLFNPSFLILNSYSAGLSSSVMCYLIKTVLLQRFGKSIINNVNIIAEEIGLNVSANNFNFPCGNTVIVEFYTN